MLEPHNIRWSEEFTGLQKIYMEALGPLALRVEHVGSTSVPDLLAKPILDIDIVISGYENFPQLVAILERLGHFHNGDQGIPEREAFKSKDEFAPHISPPRKWMTHHLYVCPEYTLDPFCFSITRPFASIIMASNIEIKARLPDAHQTRILAERISDSGPTEIKQRDTFFACPNGRLKLREFSPTHGELIYYRRENKLGAKRSDYLISPTDSPPTLLAVLSAAFKATQVVTKTRTLYLVGQTRIHLDEVVGLGSFLELEVVLYPEQSPLEGHEIARKLMDSLEIEESQLIDCAYADLLPPNHCVT